MQEQQEDCFGKGLYELKDHARFFSKITSIFKKVLHLKDLNRHLECTDVSFNPENGAFSKIETDRQTNRVTK